SGAGGIVEILRLIERADADCRVGIEILRQRSRHDGRGQQGSRQEGAPQTEGGKVMHRKLLNSVGAIVTRQAGEVLSRRPGIHYPMRRLSFSRSASERTRFACGAGLL